MLVVRIKDDTDHLWNVTQNNGVLILNNYDVDNAITTENISFCLFPIDHLNFIYDFQKSF